jgi:hypothetical protein
MCRIGQRLRAPQAKKSSRSRLENAGIPEKTGIQATAVTQLRLDVREARNQRQAQRELNHFVRRRTQLVQHVVEGTEPWLVDTHPFGPSSRR